MRVGVVANYARSFIAFRGRLVEALVAAGHEVVVGVPGPLAGLPGELGRRGASCSEIRLRRRSINPVSELRALFDLRGFLRRAAPDYVLFYTIKPMLYGAAAASLPPRPRFACVVTGLGYAFAGRGPGRGLLTLVVKRLYRVALRRAERVFFLNEDDRRLFLVDGLVHPQRTVVLAGEGVDLEEFVPAAEPPDPGSFLLVARLLREKGIVEFVEAARALKARHPDASFRLLGPPEHGPSAVPLDQVRRWTQDGTIDYLGETDDVRPYLARAAVCVLPSYREGLSRTILEAMAMGRAVVTTDVAGCRDAVTDGSSGLLVPVADSVALAGAMERFLGEPQLARTMGREGRRSAEARFDVRAVNRAILEATGLDRGASPSRARTIHRGP